MRHTPSNERSKAGRGKLTLTERMRRIRKTDTKPELIVRRMVHAMGYRYRLHDAGLPGTPDIVLPRHRKVILVHGCFWHRHDCPDGRKLPRSKPEYWAPKLERNRRRDEANIARLREMGWKVLVVWECEVRVGVAGAVLAAYLSERTECQSEVRKATSTRGATQGNRVNESTRP